jgi:hypothetical protein
MNVLAWNFITKVNTEHPAMTVRLHIRNLLNSRRYFAEECISEEDRDYERLSPNWDVASICLEFGLIRGPVIPASW